MNGFKFSLLITVAAIQSMASNSSKHIRML